MARRRWLWGRERLRGRAWSSRWRRFAAFGVVRWLRGSNWLVTRGQITMKHRGRHADRQGHRLDPLDFHLRRPDQTHRHATENRQHHGVRDVVEQNGHGVDYQAVLEGRSEE